MRPQTCKSVRMNKSKTGVQLPSRPDLRTDLCVRMGYDPAHEQKPLKWWCLLHQILQLVKQHTRRK